MRDKEFDVKFSTIMMLSNTLLLWFLAVFVQFGTEHQGWALLVWYLAIGALSTVFAILSDEDEVAIIDSTSLMVMWMVGTLTWLFFLISMIVERTREIFDPTSRVVITDYEDPVMADGE